MLHSHDQQHWASWRGGDRFEAALSQRLHEHTETLYCRGCRLGGNVEILVNGDHSEQIPVKP